MWQPVCLSRSRDICYYSSCWQRGAGQAFCCSFSSVSARCHLLHGCSVLDFPHIVQRNCDAGRNTGYTATHAHMVLRYLCILFDLSIFLCWSGFRKLFIEFWTNIIILNLFTFVLIRHQWILTRLDSSFIFTFVILLLTFVWVSVSGLLESPKNDFCFLREPHKHLGVIKHMIISHL